MKEEAASTDGEDLEAGKRSDADVKSDAPRDAEEDALPAPVEKPPSTTAKEAVPDAEDDALPASEEKPASTTAKAIPPKPTPSKRKATKLERFSMLMFGLGALGLALAKIRDRTHEHEFNLDGFRIVAIGATALVAIVLGILIARRGRDGRGWGSVGTDVATTLLGTYLFASSGLDAANRMIPTRWERLVGIVQEHRSENGRTHAKVWIVDRGVDTYFWRPLPLELEAKIDVYVRRGIFGMRIGTLAPPS